MKVLPPFLGWLVGLSLCLAVTPAWAWVETRLVNDEVTVEVDRTASAVIDHRITMRVHGGPLKSFDLAIADKEPTPLESVVTPAGGEGTTGAQVPLELVPRPNGGLRVNVTAPKGLSRGTFVFRVRYRRAFVAGDDIRRDGAMLRLRFTDASWPEGRDNVRAVFVLPAAPTEPRAPSFPSRNDSNAPFEPNDGVFLTETKRAADHDEVLLVRPHVARGEAVAWTVYVDPRALGDVTDPGLRPAPPPAPPRAEVSPQRRAAYVAGAAILLFGFSFLVGIKARHVARSARGRAVPRPLLPLSGVVRAVLAGPAVLAGVAMQLFLDDPWWGTSAVFLALLLAAHRRASSQRSPRGPGKWLLLSDADAFVAPPDGPGSWLDASTRAGRTVFALALACVAVVTYFVAKVSAYHAYLVAFDAAVLFPIFGTGRRDDLPPDPIGGAGPRLRRIAVKLRAQKSVRAVAWARLPDGGDRFDELRLLCTPRVPLRGFVGIEIGLVPVSGIGGWIFLPELLVRVIDASPSHDAFRKLQPGARWVRGRRAEERVTTVMPRLPTLAMVTSLAIRLVDHARDTAPPSVARKVAPAEARGVQRPAGRSSPNSANAANAATRSAGSGECASNAGTTASPLQPT